MSMERRALLAFVASMLLFRLSPFLGVRFESTRRVRWLWIMNAALNFTVPYALVHWGEQWIPSGLARSTLSVNRVKPVAGSPPVVL